MAKAYRWLPIEAAERPGVRARLSGVIESWAQDWFIEPGFDIANVRAAAGGAKPAMDGGSWSIPRQSIGVSCPRRALTRLVELALDARLNPATETEADRDLLDAFGKALMEDLVERLETDLGAGDQGAAFGVARDPFHERGGLTLDLVDRGFGQLLSIAIPFGLLRLACFSDLRPSRQTPVRLTPIAQVIGRERLALEAILGEAELSMEAFEGMEVGDVIVLDSSLNEPAWLMVAGGGAAVARAQLTERDAVMALVVEG